MNKRYYRVEEVADYLGFSVSGIRKWVRSGRIPFTRLNGGIRFDMQEIEKWASRNRRNFCHE
jgi:excisionase family DNA binding protein